MLDAVHISDLHLGSPTCQVKELEDFLDHLKPTRRLILGGDILQGTEYRLAKRHWRILSTLRRLSDQTELIWVHGNHDHDAESVAHIVGAKWYREFIYRSGEKTVLTIHGDAFDDFIKAWPLVTWMADVFYQTVQKLSLRLAVRIKRRSKLYLRCANQVRTMAIAYCRMLNADLVVCGHSHHAEQDDIYFNTGCWTDHQAHALEVKDGMCVLTEVI